MFDQVGAVGYPADAVSAEEMFEAALEAGADDCESGEVGHEVICADDQLSDVRDALEARFGPPASAKLVWRPQNLVPVDEDTADQLFRLLEALEDSDDVQAVSANYDVPEDVMEKLSA